MVFGERGVLIICFIVRELGEGGVRGRGSLVLYKTNYNLIDI